MKFNKNINKNGFTLIELLAVIIILGVLMIIAIPSVTQYIQDSRKNAYITTVKEYINGTSVIVNSGKLELYDRDVTYYIPTTCVPLEKGGDSPFGEFDPAYVVVTYDGNGYDYYFAGRDTASMGINLTYEKLLSKDLIKTGVKNIDTTIGVGERSTIIRLTDSCLLKDADSYVVASVIEEEGKYNEDGNTIVPITPRVLIDNSDFVYGAYYDVTKFDSTNKDKLTTGDYVKGKTSDILLKKQSITVKVTDSDVSKYNVTIGYFDADGNYTGRSGILPMTNGELTIMASSIPSTHFRVSVYIYSPFKKIPETANIMVYEWIDPNAPHPEAPIVKPANVLLVNREFEDGAYFDNDRYGTNDRLTSGSYALIKSADLLLSRQSITVKVTDTDVSSYKVTLGYFDADGNYTGRSGILAMTNGELTILASSIPSTHFRVNVYKMPSGFQKIESTANITVYKGESTPAGTPTTSWEGKHISVVGDSISTGSYPSLVGSLTGATVKNYSTSGITLSGTSGNTIVTKVAAMTETTDLVIVFGGTNDYWHKSTNIGTLGSTDANTYYGALKNILDNLKSKYPSAKYLFLFPYDQSFGGDLSSTNYGKGTLGDFRSAFINFCTTNNVNYIDLGTTSINYSSHTNDGVHANSAGHQIIAQAIYDYITTKF